jgi:pimeloyl-ACP methyl ester carboxylesterase
MPNAKSHTPAQTARFNRPGLPHLACRHQPGSTPTVVFCPGFLSDMTGSKAQAVADLCAVRGQACLLLDYSGHGSSGGDAAAGTIEVWRDDVLALVDKLTTGPLVLVGSSMGGWLALLVALARPLRVQALVLIAPAPDFTDWGVAQKFNADQLAELAATGRVAIPSQYGPEPYVYTQALIDAGARCRLLDRPVQLDAPIRILHGQCDPDVPWQLSLTLAEKLHGPDVRLTLVKDGDHRLSRAGDIALLCQTLETLL